MNRTLSLIRYARTQKGWRRGPAVVGKNGKLKPNVMIFGGAEIACPEGRFQMVRYQSKRAVYTDLGNDPVEVMDKFRAAEAKQKVVVAAVAAGIAAPDSTIDTQRKTIKKYAADFLTMHRNLPHRSN
ncbi:MAG TPA: hypothetical protein VMU28_10100, partial [Terriglobales bacterium]|nr:hypothetical protein [Terriglobales bacterium]